MFTKEEVKAAKATRDAIIEENISELKSIYMAGEIVMWDECEQKNLHKAHVSGRLPNAEDVKRWFQLLVGKSEIEMQKDIEATLR